jgi:hypothetical protein
VIRINHSKNIGRDRSAMLGIIDTERRVRVQMA